MPGVGVDEVELQKLTRRHAIKLLPVVTCSVEDAAYAIGELVGFQSVKAASRMNSAIVIFLNDVAKAEKVVESGVVIHDTFTPVFPLANPGRRIMISNTPPFIKNEDLTTELSRYGRVISPIKMMMMGSEPHRRQTFMVLKDGDKDLNLSLSFKVDGFNYIVFVTAGVQRSDVTADQSEREEMEQEQAVTLEENITAKKSMVTPDNENKHEKKKKDKEHNVNVDEVVNEVVGEEEVEEDSGDEVGEECDMTPSQEVHTPTYSLREIKKCS